jgi:HEAT repeat protein
LRNAAAVILPCIPTRRTVARVVATIAILVCALPPRALAHGGAYNPAGSGATGFPGSGAPAGPSPSTGMGPNAVQTGGLLRRESWEDWWHFNKDPYLELKRAVSTGMPATEANAVFGPAAARSGGVDFTALLRTRVLPALRELVKTETSPDVVSAALVALARVTASASTSPTAAAPASASMEKDAVALRSSTIAAAIETISTRLADSNQEIAETAALALGILRDEDALPTLELLLADGERGRTLAGGHGVPARTRAFAAYGIGLVAHSAKNNRARQVAARALCTALAERHAALADVEVASVLALSLDRIEASANSGAAAWVSRQSEIALLRSVLADEKRPAVVRAHALTAIARLATDAPAETVAPVEESFLAALQVHAKTENGELQSSAQALGLLGDAGDGPIARRMRTTLGLVLKDPDAQARWFAVVALGEMGSRESPDDAGEEGLAACRDTISNLVARGMGAIRPWAAIALGLLERRTEDRLAAARTAASGNGGAAPPKAPTAGDPNAAMLARSRELLREYFFGAKLRTHFGAGALALGLVRDREAVPMLLERLTSLTEDQGQAYVALALGMIGDPRAIGPLREVAAKSEFRPDSLEQAATALALLGDRSAAPKLAEWLAKAGSQSAQASIARALGKIGDVRTIQPLLEIAGKKDAPALTRAFAIVALGQVGDLDLLPWYVPISSDLNYTQTTSTLIAGDGTGILEIL